MKSEQLGARGAKGSEEVTKLKGISILGCGVVGMTLGTGLLKLGHNVVFYDIDESKIQECRRNNLDATLSINEAIEKSDVSFICVPTPTNRGKIDLSYVRKIVKSLARALKSKQTYHLVVVKSTVTPMTTEETVVPIIEKYSRKKIGTEIGVCVNPEFLTEIHRSWTHSKQFVRDFFSEPVIIIGGVDRRSGNYLESIYAKLKRPTVRMNLRTAEMAKYAFNCALASRISYWNEIFYICQTLGIDSTIVAQTASLDERIGKYGTIHGKAFGGKCLPKDLRAFITFAKDHGYNAELLKAVEHVNERIKADKGARE
jgi:UDPglucose 6-dehydrogenase